MINLYLKKFKEAGQATVFYYYNCKTVGKKETVPWGTNEENSL